jgi:hypothetical protein
MPASLAEDSCSCRGNPSEVDVNQCPLAAAGYGYLDTRRETGLRDMVEIKIALTLILFALLFFAIYFTAIPG